MAAREQSLFKPGDGAAPPALTGRALEQGVLLRCLADLDANAAPPHNVVLVGPRGNGKTVLLNWFETACGNGRKGVDAVRLTPRDIPDQEALTENMVPRRGLAFRESSSHAAGQVLHPARLQYHPTSLKP